MFIALVISALVGLFAARSIVAESDAHRFELTDRWYNPTCDTCTSTLNALLTSCTKHRHRQRRTNIFVLGATVVLSAALASVVPTLWVLPAYLVFLWTMILLTVTDLDTQLIPNRILGPATAVGSVLLLIGHLFDTSAGSLTSALLGAVAYFLVMYLLASVVRGGLGFGDVKLAFLIGLFTGYYSLGHVLVAGIGSFFIGGAVSLILLIGRKRTRKDAIPFGPFMTIAALLALFIGQDVLDWYLR